VEINPASLPVASLGRTLNGIASTFELDWKQQVAAWLEVTSPFPGRGNLANKRAKLQLAKPLHGKHFTQLKTDKFEGLKLSTITKSVYSKFYHYSKTLALW